jgi:hypothetical protein
VFLQIHRNTETDLQRDLLQKPRPLELPQSGTVRATLEHFQSCFLYLQGATAEYTLSVKTKRV